MVSGWPNHSLPTRYLLLGVEWRIDYLPPDHPTMNEEGTRLFGWCDDDLNVIGINTDQSAYEIRDTLVHELVHAYCSSCPEQDTRSAEEEEVFVTLVTEIFFEVVDGSIGPWYTRY